MTRDEAEARARNRFIMMNLVGIGGTIVVLFSLLLWQTDRIVAGGSILGLPLAFVGLFISFLGPRWLARRWKTPPR
ncbi:hypothetical protein GCM10023232_26210 [Sphingosinicella ginsenosidimutans]|uniref:Uncharacterized protein n=1 Tax=Allosphingosinicella ginsenosidimutans TaxID=1176539 RepID=A0A5C6TUW8_9SPHN|nr:hypothetical protein [Sphingosinicella ginsenosidimutans]TXC63761.1 hypothetical protein FRZ32_08850 [Sphingosinicella ginsenosidimutans]